MLDAGVNTADRPYRACIAARSGLPIPIAIIFPEAAGTDAESRMRKSRAIVDFAVEQITLTVHRLDGARVQEARVHVEQNAKPFQFLMITVDNVPRAESEIRQEPTNAVPPVYARHPAEKAKETFRFKQGDPEQTSHARRPSAGLAETE